MKLPRAFRLKLPMYIYNLMKINELQVHCF